MRKSTKVVLAAVLAVGLLAQTGCVFRRERIVERAGASRTADKSVISLEGAQEGEVVLMMAAGELSLTGGAGEENLLEGDFIYRPATLTPIVEESKSTSRKQVVIRNDDRTEGLGDFSLFDRAKFRNDWVVSLSEAVPIEQLSVTLGAGNSDLDLRGVDVRSLSVELGAGDTTVDLSGKRESDIEGSIEAGAGKVTVRLPQDVGVRVSGAQDGIGDWKADGFIRRGDDLVNDVYETADIKIELNVQRGVGEVRLELVD